MTSRDCGGVSATGDGAGGGDGAGVKTDRSSKPEASNTRASKASSNGRLFLGKGFITGSGQRGIRDGSRTAG